jgi:hypothetical protein
MKNMEEDAIVDYKTPLSKRHDKTFMASIVLSIVVDSK